MVKGYFTSDSYTTPPNMRSITDKIFLDTSWYFLTKYIDIMLKARSKAVKGSYDNEAWNESSINTMKLIEACGGKLEISGMENIRKLNEPVVYISNHMSTLETFVFPSLMLQGGDVSFVVKESLTTDFIFGPVMRSTNPIVVRRVNPREDLQTVMQKGKELLQSGTSVIIFPQHTRDSIFKTSEFNTLGIKLAKTAGVKVLPVAIKTDFWKRGKIIKELGGLDRDKTIYFKFASPMEIVGQGKEEHKRIIEFISENLKNWGATVSNE